MKHITIICQYGNAYPIVGLRLHQTNRGNKELHVIEGTTVFNETVELYAGEDGGLAQHNHEEFVAALVAATGGRRFYKAE